MKSYLRIKIYKIDKQNDFQPTFTFGSILATGISTKPSSEYELKINIQEFCNYEFIMKYFKTSKYSFEF